MDLNDYSTQQLLAEIEKRENLLKALPVPLTDDEVKENLFKLKEVAIQDVLNHSKGEAYGDDGHYIWEEVISAVYGRTIWDWWNKR